MARSASSFVCDYQSGHAGGPGGPAGSAWVDSAADVPKDAGRGEVGGHGALVTVGNIALQGDGSVRVAASIDVASLAAAGQTYGLRKEDGVWAVKWMAWWPTRTAWPSRPRNVAGRCAATGSS